MTDTQKIKLIKEITREHFEFGVSSGTNKGAYLEGILTVIDNIVCFQEEENDT